MLNPLRHDVVQATKKDFTIDMRDCTHPHIFALSCNAARLNGYRIKRHANVQPL
jgi:hypothetical protein